MAAKKAIHDEELSEMLKFLIWTSEFDYIDFSKICGIHLKKRG